ncbi:MAG: DUF6635 family protein [Bdellovibrio sp.]
MTDQNSAIALGILDEFIEQYIESRRKNIDTFIQGHFSVNETITIQKQFLSRDLFLIPINTLWSIPYLSIKKVIETLDKIGFPQFNSLLEKIPPGFKTGYQKEIEKIISNELLDLHNLMTELENNQELGKFFERDRIAEVTADALKEIGKEIEKYTSSKAIISDLTSSLMTLALGWMLFKDKTLGIFGLGNKIARKMAHNNAASGFFLGKGLGSAFYNAFPPEPTKMQVFVATLGVGIFMTVLSLAVSIMCDPLRKSLGLHNKNLNILVDNLEGTLFLHLKKEIKKTQKDSMQMSEVC